MIIHRFLFCLLSVQLNAIIYHLPGPIIDIKNWDSTTTTAGKGSWQQHTGSISPHLRFTQLYFDSAYALGLQKRSLV